MSGEPTQNPAWNPARNPARNGSQSPDCLIVGAGLAGLTAARHLASAGRTVLIVDKAKSVGGRLATRRIGAARLDHGAQFFTVRDPAFNAEVETWVTDGVVEVWCHGFGKSDGHPRFRALEGMNGIAKYLAERLRTDLLRPPTIVTRAEANAIIAGPEHWAVTYEASRRVPDEVQAVISTAPIPQSLRLLDAGATTSDHRSELEAIEYNKVIAVLAVLDRSPRLPAPGAVQQPDDPTFTFVADNHDKGISKLPAVTFHCSHRLSDELWDLDDGRILTHVHDKLRSYLGGAAVQQVQIKRWRFAGPVSSHPERYVTAADRPGPLVFAGDGFAGAKVEGAFVSGLAAAQAVLDAR
ncbi:MAG: FAD-dependent oxidoreductase [Acidimicrobiia bacterium]|nr:FAD-dependent oxidoreductase [Acidimicrobiia bacterium]